RRKSIQSGKSIYADSARILTFLITFSIIHLLHYSKEKHTTILYLLETKYSIIRRLITFSYTMIMNYLTLNSKYRTTSYDRFK
ncbi:MAG TPA: hypothetical protein PLW93_06450, partial [Candidatus Absconditabacterales bacterium]|nr:hypothetical protein [Candidatus Absconditabacterales bacterium]